MLGFGGRLIRIFTYGAQIRFVGDNFVPVYFDSTYDLSRAERYALTEGALSSPGYIGWFATIGTSLLNDSIVFKASLEGPFGEVDGQRAELPELPAPDRAASRWPKACCRGSFSTPRTTSC